jgi:hypothetical protein
VRRGAMGSEDGKKSGPLSPLLQKARRFWNNRTLKEKVACGAGAAVVVRRLARRALRAALHAPQPPCSALRRGPPRARTPPSRGARGVLAARAAPPPPRRALTRLCLRLSCC